MSPLDKLARRICWLGFPHTPKDKTEATYWASLPHGTHEGYRREAELFLLNLRALRRTTSSQAIVSEALRSLKSRRVSA